MSVTVLPDRGCDLYALVDGRTGIDLLAKSPWGLQPTCSGSRAADSTQHWLQGYPGGWQVLIPNGGDACTEHGVEWGFHGEASLLPWRIGATGDDFLELSTSLRQAPLEIRRRIEVHERVLRIAETVQNRSRQDLEIMWVHHPAFGPPFVDDTTVLATGARLFSADGRAPGTLFGPHSRHPWPNGTSVSGAAVDLTRLPQHLGEAILGYLGDFDHPYVAQTNHRLGLGVGLTWSHDVMPHAWLWLERHSSADYPWYGQMDVVAVEPASTVPAWGVSEARRGGGNLVKVPAEGDVTLQIEAVLFHDTRPVSRIGFGGAVHFIGGSHL